MKHSEILTALNRWHRRQFDYGDADCCQFAGFIVKQLTGVDYLHDFNYASEKDAYSIIEQNGSLKETVSTALGDPDDDLVDGSPCLVQMNNTELLGIKLGDAIVCLTKKGMARVSFDNLICGWSRCLKL